MSTKNFLAIGFGFLDVSLGYWETDTLWSEISTTIFAKVHNVFD
jgi:hypothetical protein